MRRNHILRNLAAAALVVSLLIAVSAGCKSASSQPLDAPITAHCLQHAYHTYDSLNSRASASFAAAKCYADTSVQAELQNIQDGQISHDKDCQERQRRSFRRHASPQLATLYGAMVCIR